MHNKKEMGYARVSSKEQNLARQISALSQYVPVENILTDKESGKSLDRPSYQALKGALGLREGDTLYITSLDRLSRNKQDIKSEIEWFKSRNIRLKILDLPTSLIEVPQGQEWILEMITNILIEVLSSMAEQERLNIHKRQREGIEAAKQRGKHLGRPKTKLPDNFNTVYKLWSDKVITTKEAYQRLGLSRSTFYRFVSQYEK